MSDNPNKIMYLKQYTAIIEERKELMQSYEEVISKLTTIAAQVISDMPRTGHDNPDKIGNNIVHIEKLEKILEKNLKETLRIRIDIELIINQLEDSVHRRLMRLRYIRGLNFENISVIMNYSWRHTHRLHNEALDLIDLNKI